MNFILGSIDFIHWNRVREINWILTKRHKVIETKWKATNTCDHFIFMDFTFSSFWQRNGTLHTVFPRIKLDNQTIFWMISLWWQPNFPKKKMAKLLFVFAFRFVLKMTATGSSSIAWYCAITTTIAREVRLSSFRKKFIFYFHFFENVLFSQFLIVDSNAKLGFIHIRTDDALLIKKRKKKSILLSSFEMLIKLNSIWRKWSVGSMLHSTGIVSWWKLFTFYQLTVVMCRVALNDTFSQSEQHFKRKQIMF